MKTADFNKEEWISIARLIWPQGDGYYAELTKTGKVRIGYTNDYPMQHGTGEGLILPQSMLPLFASQPSTLTVNRQELEKVLGEIWDRSHDHNIDHERHEGAFFKSKYPRQTNLHLIGNQ